MSIALLLIPLALLLLAAAIGAFFWAVDNDQFEDLDTVARGLLDDEAPPVAVTPAAPSPAVADVARSPRESLP